jgi:hypothetical protein
MSKGAKVISGKLEEVVRLERLTWLSRTVAALIAYGAVIAACHFALDWTFRPGLGPRLLFLAGFLVGIGYAFRQEGWLPWRRFPTRDEVALEIERGFPLLRGRFISAVQLARRVPGQNTDKPDACLAGEFGSPQLIRQLIEETSNVIANLKFRFVPDRTTRNRRLGAAGVLLLAWVAFVGLTPTGRRSFPVWLERLFNPFSATQYPTKTMVRVDLGDLTVPRGEDVELRARAEGIIPAGGSIWLQRGGRWIEQPVIGSGRDFLFVHKAVVESFTYSWRLGDGRSPDYRVTVIIPPQVRAIQARYEYPAYTRRAPETASGGNLEGLPGTHVTLSILTNKPVTKGALLLDLAREAPLAALAATTYTAALDIGTSRTSYRIRLTDEYGFENRDPMEYIIQPTADEPPHVEIKNIEERKYVTPYAALPVVVHCRDDYGITRAQLHLSIAGAREETVDVPVRINEADQTIAQTLRLEKWETKPGAEVILWASALDNRAIGEPQEGVSARVRLEVVSPEELVRLMRERMESLFPRLEQIDQDALESKTSVEDILRNGDRPTTATR